MEPTGVDILSIMVDMHIIYQKSGLLYLIRVQNTGFVHL